MLGKKILEENSIRVYIIMLLRRQHKESGRPQNYGTLLLLFGRSSIFFFFPILLCIFGHSGPNLDLYVSGNWTLPPFFENYAMIYFEAKHLEKRLNRGWWNFWCSIFQKRVFIGCCPKFLDQALPFQEKSHFRLYLQSCKRWI